MAFTKHLLYWMYRVMTGSECATVFTSLHLFLVILTIGEIVVQIVSHYHYLLKLPPGPWGWPLIGSLYSLGKEDVHICYENLAKEHGNIFSITMGNQLIVVLTDPNIISELFKNKEFDARPHTEFFNILGGYGVINAEGALWTEQKKFLHKKLRSFGMSHKVTGKKMLETTITREVDLFLMNLMAREGTPTSVTMPLCMGISNVICSVMISTRFTTGDARFQRFSRLIEQGFRLFGKLMTINYIPIARFMPWFRPARNQLAKNRVEMAKFFQENIDWHRETFDKNNIRDLIDTYLLRIEEANSQGVQLFCGRNPDQQMQQVIGDLFSAGMETVKTSLEWAFLYMIHYPEACKAVQEELDGIVGRSRMPNLEDRQNLHVTNATIHEVLRCSSAVPLGTTHAATCNVEINGHLIPKGAQVIPLLHAVHMNENIWKQPTKFNPRRFLTSNDKLHVPKFFMAFGAGRRKCLGEALAQMELFLFFTNVLHRYDLEVPEGHSLPSLKGNAGVTITPAPFQICFVRRDKEPPVRFFGSK